MRLPTIVRIAYELLSIAAPTVSAFLIGDMADYLLAGDTANILSRLPYFVAAVVFIALIVPLVELCENLLLTKHGFAYDAFLAERFIRLPLIKTQQLEAGAVMERFEEDSASYCFCQVFKRCRPPVLMIYIAALVYVAFVRKLNLLFMAAIMVLSVLPLVWAKLSAGLKARLDRESLEYADERKDMEHDAFRSRDFFRSFKLESGILNVFRNMFEKYFVKTGKRRVLLTALSSMLDYAFSYGAQIFTVVLGAVLISKGSLTAGELLGGVLLLPSISKWYQFASTLVFELRHEKECLGRIALFYTDEPETPDEDAAPSDYIELKNVSFKYPNAQTEAVRGKSFTFSSDSVYMLSGANGSGKTTLLNLLGGLYGKAGGTISGADGRPLSMASLRKSVAVQEQNGAIFSGTVFENLFVEDRRRDEAQKLLDAFGFAKPLDHNVAEGGANLSPGEQKKLLLVRALMRKAPFIVLDEPLNHLDPQGSAALSHRLAARRRGIIIASHKGIEGVNVPKENICSLDNR